MNSGADGKNANQVWEPRPISLRDWFAGQALAGLCSDDEVNVLSCEQVANDCYELADAMLRAGGHT
jgi:hypothetical protein